MARIGFLGLGEMGTPMASRLLHACHDVIVWNRTVERTAPLAQHSYPRRAPSIKASGGTVAFDSSSAEGRSHRRASAFCKAVMGVRNESWRSIGGRAPETLRYVGRTDAA